MYKVTGTNEAVPITTENTQNMIGDITAPWDSYNKTTNTKTVNADNLPDAKIKSTSPRITETNTEHTVFPINTITTNLGDDVVRSVYNPNRIWSAGVQFGSGNNQWYNIPINASSKSNASGVSSTNMQKKSTKPVTASSTTTSTSTSNISTKPNPNLLKANNSEMAGITTNPIYPSKLISPVTTTSPRIASSKTSWGDVISTGLSGIASLAPVVSNLFTSDPETVNTNYNPYANTIARTMRNRRFDITPAIEDLNRSRAISNYNAGLINPNTGTNIAFRLQSALGQNRAIADLRAQESNVNNQYAADYASTLNNLGQQYVGATNLSAEQNAQNRAAARNTRRAGLSQLSQWVQNRELMRNQRTRDDAMLDLYKPFLESGYSSDVL
jgi:hypothetical protein